MKAHRPLVWLALATAAAAYWPALASATGVLPAPLAATAEDAEDLVGRFMDHDWRRALPLVQEIRSVQPDLIKLMRQQRMPESSIDKLRAASTRMQQLTTTEREPLAAAEAANQIAGITAALESYYPTAVPARVARLDFLGRAVMLLARHQDQGAALTERTREIQETWQQLAPGVVKRSGGGVVGTRVATAMDEVIADLQRDHSARALGADAKRVLDLVDELETLFVHAPAPRGA